MSSRKHPANKTLLINNGSNSIKTTDDKFLLPTFPDGSINNIDITLVEPYENNPRTTQSEKFRDLKESIMSLGLQSPFSITLRPNEEKYTVYGGGNTRLEALKSLYADTKDDKYRYVNLIYKTYTDDDTMLVLHVAENHVRSNLTFFELAKVMMTIRDRHLKKNNISSINDTELFNLCKSQGIPIQRQYIETLKFANEISKFLPSELVDKNGNEAIGRPRLEKLLKLEKNIIKTCERISLESDPQKEFNAEEISSQFKDLVADSHDHFNKGDFDPIYDSVARRLSRKLDVEISEFNRIFSYIEDPTLEEEIKKQLAQAEEEAKKESSLDNTDTKNLTSKKENIRKKIVSSLTAFFNLNPNLENTVSFLPDDNDKILDFTFNEESIIDANETINPQDFSERQLGLIYQLKLIAYSLAIASHKKDNDEVAIESLYDSLNDRYNPSLIYPKTVFASDIALIQLLGEKELIEIDSTFTQDLADSYKILTRTFKAVTTYIELLQQETSKE